MTNLNQELIEKVRQGKAAIHNDQNKENKEKLRTLLSVIFPEDNPEMCYSNMEYYYASTDLKIWTCADDLPRGLEAIPLSAFFTNELPKEDLNLIAKMDERLKKLETLLDEALAKETPESLTQWLLSKRSIAPVDTKEGFGFCVKAEFSQVVKCSTQCEYCEQRERNLSQQGEQPKGHCGNNSSIYHGEYPELNPIKTQPKEWKVGEFVLDGIVIGYVTQVMNDRVLATNLAGNWAMNVEFSKAQKPTKEQVEQHLTKIAREKYPVGTKVKTITGTFLISSFVISSHEFKYNHDNNSLLALIRYGGKDYYKTVWNLEDGWATIIKEEVKERYGINVCANHSRFDVRVYGIETESQANELKEKIKALLATL